MTQINQAVILAAGKGTRLSPVTDWTPKALVPFLGRPLIDQAAAHVVAAGARRVAVNAYHLGHAVAAYVSERLRQRYPSVQWYVSREEALLGTGGALKALEDWFEPEPFLVVNADAVFAEPLARLVAHHHREGGQATWMVTREPLYAALRVVCRSEKGHLQRISSEALSSGSTFCGIHVCEPGLLSILPEGHSCVVRQGYLPWIEQGAKVSLWETHQFWADTGTPERYIDAHARGLANRERFEELGLLA